MPHPADLLVLPHNPPGTVRMLGVRRFGRPGARPKAYLQAGLHADEIPGMLVAHHLASQLAAAEASGILVGEVVLVPVANPIGLAQRLHGVPLGRHALDRGGNFNRDFPDLTGPVATAVADLLGPDAAANLVTIRTALQQALAQRRPTDAVGGLRHRLSTLAIDADLVLDLHCDQESILHLYTGEALWPAGADLAAWLGAEAVFLSDDSGGNPFDEACAAPWWRLAARFGPDRPVPPGCFAATIELRGQRDVDDDLARADAEALFRWLQGRGVVAGPARPPPALHCRATPLAGVDRVAVPRAGIVCHQVALGQQVTAGQVVGEIVDPTEGDATASRTPLVSRTAGKVWARSLARFALAGDSVISIAGAEPLAERDGALLTD